MPNKHSYKRLEYIHNEAFPEMRMGQFLLNLLGWIHTTKRDPFFIDENELVKYAEEYAKEAYPLYLGWGMMHEQERKIKAEKKQDS